MSSDLALRPRSTPMAGKKKPTHRWCEPCGVLHRTRRAVGGPDACPHADPDDHGETPHPPTIRLKSLGPNPANPFGPAHNPDKGRWV